MDCPSGWGGKKTLQIKRSPFSVVLRDTEKGGGRFIRAKKIFKPRKKIIGRLMEYQDLIIYEKKVIQKTLLFVQSEINKNHTNQ